MMDSEEIHQVENPSLASRLAGPATAPPVLSTPDTHIFEAPVPLEAQALSLQGKLTDSELWTQYGIQRTADELRAGEWRKVALQFPDEMLGDAVRVYDALYAAFNSPSSSKIVNDTSGESAEPTGNATEGEEEVRLCILGDTSYGACCVDEIAAEHVDAQVVVHYGRTCFSATARLPVIYVYTARKIDLERVADSFKASYVDKAAKVVLVADAPYATHIQAFADMLRRDGYEHVFETQLVRDSKSPIPNRTIPDEVVQDGDRLRDWHVFHIGQPPTALLLTLASRVASMTVYANNRIDDKAVRLSSALTLRRRYALVTSLSTCAVYGILINTLSVKNYLHIVEHVKQQISAAGKKFYVFVVGKVNAAKIANFSEVGGWVVIGCWESSLVESSEFYVPLITPFELRLALQADEERVWTGEWTSDFEAVLDSSQSRDDGGEQVSGAGQGGGVVGDARASDSTQVASDYDSEDESAPPEFDLRTGRYIQHSRPMQRDQHRSNRSPMTDGQASVETSLQADKSLVARPKGDIARVGNIVSPGAEYLRSQRTWQGLGSDFDLETDFTDSQMGSLVEQGRSGVARGYSVGDDKDKT